MQKPNTIETERLLLKPATTEDAAFVLELLNTPKWKQFIGDRKVNTIEDAENYITVRFLPQFERLGYGNYVVTRKSDEIKVGSCGIYDRDGLDGVDLGFAFLPEYEKKGYAFEAASSLVESAKKKFNIEKLLAITVAENKSSQNLLTKLGFTYQKLIVEKESNEELMLFDLNLK